MYLKKPTPAIEQMVKAMPSHGIQKLKAPVASWKARTTICFEKCRTSASGARIGMTVAAVPEALPSSEAITALIANIT